ncbi:hypothetical protein [Amycolatopsis sp. WAC 01376]|nr:hypothetical protein [Amycolatopsis sp. WAC 01376]
MFASTTEPFEARAATLGAVADWIPGSEKSLPRKSSCGKGIR